MDTTEPPTTPLASAYDDLVEKVSIAGWKEAFVEKVIWIRRIFQIVVIVLSCFCLYYNTQCIRDWLTKSSYTNEIRDVVNLERMPFSNMTFCAQVYFNQEFVKQH